MENKPLLLSICIPTFNRCEILREVLTHYVNNTEFDDEVEIIISDNASTDNTYEMCMGFCKKVNNIHYYRNSENIHDSNFVKVLDLAKGEYLKLFNDWVYCTSNYLKYIKDVIRNSLVSRKPIFFTSNHIFTRYNSEVVTCCGLDDYVKVVSTFVTYNNIFGAWRDQWGLIKDKRKYSSLLLQQEDWTYQIVSVNNGCVIYNRPIFKSANFSLGIRGGYNWFNVHLDNYYVIMKPYVDDGSISKSTFINDKHNLLKHFKKEIGLALFYNYDTFWKFETKGTWKLLMKYYKYDIYFYWFLIILSFNYSFNSLRFYSRLIFLKYLKK